MRHFFVFLFFILFAIQPVEAQFINKLKDKVKDKVEDKITDRASEEAADRADKEMDKVFEKQDTEYGQPAINLGAFNMSSLDDIPDNYDFEWKYVLEMTDKSGDKLPITYNLKQDAKYMGMTYKDEKSVNMDMVMDFDRQLMAMFMDDGENKTAMVTKIDFQQIAYNSQVDQEDTIHLKIENLPEKTILGYKCKGYRIEDEEAISTIYVTTDSPVGFVDVFSGSKLVPKNAKREWISSMANGLFMEMDYQSKKKKKDSFKMECTSLDKEKKVITKAGYKSMMDIE